jgi:hypothetical protein
VRQRWGEEENAKIAVLSGSETYIAGRTESRERERAARGREKNVVVILVNPSSGELGY